MAAQGPHDLYISVVTLGEVERGIHREEARHPGLASDLRRWMAFAVARGLTIATGNVADFAPAGLRVANLFDS